MEWIITAALITAVFALLAVIVLRSKRHDSGTAPGRFELAGYKEGELSKRGLFDKTKWR
ncbi:MAG: hypothetical protein ACLGQH_10570 [Acidobacteriota bacterium]